MYVRVAAQRMGQGTVNNWKRIVDVAQQSDLVMQKNNVRAPSEFGLHSNRGDKNSQEVPPARCPTFCEAALGNWLLWPGCVPTARNCEPADGPVGAGGRVGMGGEATGGRYE